MSNTQQLPHWLHRFAMLTTVASFALLCMGGLVTSTGSALAVPDWPTTFGHNMFLYPLSSMVGGILYEHSHRLLGALVGLLTIVLTVWLWLREPRRWLRWLGSVALTAVIMQGVLGGLRVLLLDYNLAMLHACMAQAFFALLVSIAFFTAPVSARQPTETAVLDHETLRRLCALATALIYLQMVFGAILRHTGDLLQVHILGAVLVVLPIAVINIRAWQHHAQHDFLVRPIMTLAILLMAQLGLGLGSYLVRHTAFATLASPAARIGLTTAHLALGSLMFATSLVLTLRTYRLRATPATISVSAALTEQVS